MGVIEDLLKEIRMQQEVTSKILYALYMQEQRREAAKVPGRAEVYYCNINSPTAMELIGANVARDAFDIYNGGPSVVFVATEQFNEAQMLARYNAGATSEVLRVYPLMPSSNITIPTKKGLWVWNINYGGANANAQLFIVETMFEVPMAAYRNPVQHSGFAGRFLKGLDFTEDKVEDTVKPMV